MNVIKKKTLESYGLHFADTSSALLSWRKIVEKTNFSDIHAVRAVFPSADFADPYTIFNIKGNNYRLVTVIHYRYRRVYIREFFTHAEYDQWNKDRKRSKPK
jgi:mRNA interferase HigB